MSAHRGGLLELVARGKKDVFFTANPQASFFHSVYARYAPFTEEVYVCQPKNAPEWGRWMEFDVEHRGDLMRKIYLRIRLPTWLPDSLAAVNGTSLITDAAGVSYGYCNNIGYQVIEKIQLFQDQVLVQELYGEYLDWRLRQTNTLAQTLVIATTAGTRGETVIDVGRAATPGLLRVPIPLVGWEAIGEPGFPMAAMRQQRFRLRVLLRRLEDVVVASDDRSQPQPWGKPLRVQYAKGGPVDTSQVARPREALNKDIEVSLETSQVYVPADVQQWLKIQKWQIPFKNVQWQEFTIADNQLAAASVNDAFTLPFTVDFTGPATRLLFAFQSLGARLAGNRTELLRDAVQTLRFNIANIDRIQPFASPVFREVTSYWKNKRSAQDLVQPDRPQDVYTFVFGGMDAPQPYGTLNFTRAVETILYAVFSRTIPIDPRTQSRDAFLTTYLETFDVWVVENGRGKILIDE